MHRISVAAPLRVLPAFLWMLLIFMLSAQHQRPGPAAHPVAVPQTPGASAQPTQDLFDILGHFGLYAVLAACLWWTLGLLPRLGPWERRALAVVGAVLYALTDEWHQSFVPGRQASAFDLQVDTMGAVTTVVLIWLAHWTVERIP